MNVCLTLNFWGFISSKFRHLKRAPKPLTYDKTKAFLTKWYYSFSILTIPVARSDKSKKIPDKNFRFLVNHLQGFRNFFRQTLSEKPAYCTDCHYRFRRIGKKCSRGIHLCVWVFIVNVTQQKLTTPNNLSQWHLNE